MRTTFSVLGLVIVVAGLAWWYHRWQNRCACLADALIQKNRFRRRPGMDRMDEPLRDRTTLRHQERARAIETFTRELDKPARRLHRAS